MFAKISVFILSFQFLNVQAFLGSPALIDPPDYVTIAGKNITPNLYFEQKVDNFNPTDTRTWKQRYHVSTEYFNSTTKNVFLLLGGEWEASETWLNYGAWLKTAEKYGALMIYLEHRYYGTSQPFSDLSTSNLRYLTVAQALEDAANFIQGINKSPEYNLPSDVKWIVFGGSYAGTMAAWLRQKYPHLVQGAMSSSAPLQAELDFHEYLQVVRNGLEKHSEKCVQVIKEAYSELDQYTGSCLEDTQIYTQMDQMFQFCETIETSEGNEKDLATLFQTLTDDIFAHTVQYNGRYSVTIDTFCDILVNENGSTPLQRLAEANNMALQQSGDQCTEYKYDILLADWRNTTIVPSSIMRQWMYQSCTEFGFFQTSSQTDPIFGTRFDLAFFTDLCVDLFGPDFNETLTSLGIEATNNRYGGVNISTSNIVYFHGNVDPWHVLGKLKTSSEVGDKVILVDGVAHCANMQPAQDSDPEALTAAREEIDKHIGQWLGVSDGGDDDDDDDDDNSSTRNLGSLFLMVSLSSILFVKVF